MSGNGPTQAVNKSGSIRKSINLANSDKKIGEDEFMAAAIGDVEWLKQSIRGNRGVINYDKNGLTPLHLAAIHGRLDCLKVMIDKFKVDMSLPSKTGWRAIHLVISNLTGKRAFNCLCYLLEQGTDPSIANDDGITPMHQAASEGHVQCLKALIEAGAPADCLDYRGHTPIDLAKLWGHRKCARLLAAEKWHQDKRVLAHEMNQLQKREMQKALRAITEDEENKADKVFYGDLAFSEWLGNRGLEPKPTGPKQEEQEHKEMTSTPKGVKLASNAAKGDGLQHANSVRKPRVTVQLKAPSPIREETSSSITPSVAHTPTKGVPMSSRHSTPSSVALHEQPSEQTSPEVSPKEQLKLHFHDWNKSTKTRQTQYVPILEDHYPHDEFSMLPKYPPKRESKTPTPTYGEHPVKKSTVVTCSDESCERPVVYKCKHIGDVHKKKHYDPESAPRSEVGLHISMDPDSQLFRSGLLLPIRNASRRSRRRSRSSDLQSIMLMMERVRGSPRYFPIVGAAGDSHTAAVM